MSISPKLPKMLLLLYALLLLSSTALARDPDLFGWKEEASLHSNPDAQRTQQQAKQEQHQSPSSNTQGSNSNSRGVQVLSWHPRILLYKGFLTDEEADHLVSLAQPSLSRSEVVALGGGEEESDIRTSSGTFLNTRGQTKLVEQIENKIAAWSLIPPDHGETLQILRYDNGQEYKPHFDYLFSERGGDNGGNRIATVIMYLTDTEKGGETVFPEVPVDPSVQSIAAGFTECGMEGLAVRPHKGDAVLFFSMTPDGTVDTKALHGSCPVVSGSKFAATKWLHMGHYALGGEKPVKLEPIVYGTSAPPVLPDWCTDKEVECIGWAAVGECVRNAGFMVGEEGNPGHCLRSCNRCELHPNRSSY